MFFKALKYDLKNGIAASLKKYLIVIMMAVVFCADYFLRYSQMIKHYALPPKLSVVDYVFYIFAGRDEYRPGTGDVFSFPALWTLLLVFILFMTLYYPFNDLFGFGKHILMNVRSRKIWWLSKCCWVAVTVIIVYALIFVVAIVFSLITNASFTGVLSSYALATANHDADYFSYYDCNIGIQLLQPLFVIIAMCLVQFTFSLLVKPNISFMISVAHLIAASFYMTPFLPANYAMLMRSDIITDNGMTLYSGLILPTVLSIIAVTIGMVVFSKYDILSKE